MIDPANFEEVMRKLDVSLKNGMADVEAAHVYADDLMCTVLYQLGYGKGVDIFRNMEKWYA